MTQQTDFKELSKDLALELIQIQRAMQEDSNTFQGFAVDIAKALGLTEEDMQGITVQDLVVYVSELKSECDALKDPSED